MSDNTARILNILTDSFWPLLKAGITVTVPLAIISFILGLVIAFIIALMRISNFKPLSVFAVLYVGVIRGMPLIVLLFIIFYGLPYLNIVLSPYISGIIGLSLSQGAYNSEIIRSAILSVNKGQLEATKALGMTKSQAMAYVIVPQATLVAVPPLGNMFVSLVKDTSLTAIITVLELFQVGQQIVAVTCEPLWLYIEVGVVYLIFNTALSKLQNVLEHKFGKHIDAQKS